MWFLFPSPPKPTYSRVVLAVCFDVPSIAVDAGIALTMPKEVGSEGSDVSGVV